MTPETASPGPSETEGGARAAGDSHVGGKRYSRLVTASRFPALRMLREMHKADKSNITARVFLRTLGLGFPILLYPFYRLAGRSRHLVFTVIHRWAVAVCRIARIQVDVRGAFVPEPGRSYLFASNHASPADIPIMYSILPVATGFIANRDIAVIGIFSFWTVRAGGVFVNRGDPASRTATFKRMVRSLRRGNNIALFPEGFMSKEGDLSEFKRGGLAAAAAADAVIVPILLEGTREICKPGDYIFQPDKRVIAAFGEPVDTKTLSHADRRAVHQLVWERVATMRAMHGAAKP